MKNFRVVDEFYSMCTRRKFKVNAGKTMVMVLERRQREMVDLSTPHRVSVPAVGR